MLFEIATVYEVPLTVTDFASRRLVSDPWYVPRRHSVPLSVYVQSLSLNAAAAAAAHEYHAYADSCQYDTCELIVELFFRCLKLCHILGVLV